MCQPAGDDAGASARLESDWMHRSQASWVSLGLEPDRTGAASQHTTTPTSNGAATTRGLRLRLHHLASPPASPPPLGCGGDGCAPLTQSRGSRANPARPVADSRLGCTRPHVPGPRASSPTLVGPLSATAATTRLAAQPRVGIDRSPWPGTHRSSRPWHGGLSVNQTRCGLVSADRPLQARSSSLLAHCVRSTFGSAGFRPGLRHPVTR